MAYEIHVEGPMILNSGNASEKIIDQIEGSASNFGPNRLIKSSAGDVDPTFAGYASFAPVFTGSTEMIATFLAACGISGLVPTDNGIDIFNRAVNLANALRKTGSNHQRFRLATCLCYPKSLSVSGDGVAKLNFEIIGINSAGTTNPVVLAESQALPTMTGVQEQFFLGKVMINGTELEGIQDLTIDFGIRPVVKKQGGAIYPQLVYIESRQPKISISSNNAGSLAQIGMTGLAQGSTDSVIYLRKGSANGIRVADGTAEHISFTIDDGIITVSDKGGTHPGEKMTRIEIDPVFDGSNAIIVVGTAVAIS